MIGVAKNPFKRSDFATPLRRGGSNRPLYITSVGIPIAQAVRNIAAMHGPHRFPTIPKRVDQMIRRRLLPFEIRPRQRNRYCSEKLEWLIAAFASQEDERTRSTVRKLLDEPLDLQYEETRANVSIDTATSEHFTERVIRDGDKIVYASLPATSAFVKSQEWTRAEPFAI